MTDATKTDGQAAFEEWQCLIGMDREAYDSLETFRATWQSRCASAGAQVRLTLGRLDPMDYVLDGFWWGWRSFCLARGRDPETGELTDDGRRDLAARERDAKQAMLGRSYLVAIRYPDGHYMMLPEVVDVFAAGMARVEKSAEAEGD